jgi:Zn-dependent protease with chaperone function
VTRAARAAALLLMGACVAPVSAQTLFGSLFSGNDKPVLEKLRGVPYKPSSQVIGVDKDLINQRASGYGLVTADDLQAYANGVLDKLKAASGIPGLPGKVYLSATDDLAATTTPDGNIYIGYRWFVNLNSPDYKLGQEDTLAALLAHELGHLALGHHNSDFFANAGKWLQRYYAQGMLLKSALERKVGAVANLPPEATVNLKKMQYMVEVMDGMLHPAWKRGQEEDADAFAVDVTKAAGYSYQEGVKRFVELNESVEQQQQERNTARLKVMRDNVEASLREGKMDAAITGVASQFGDQVKGLLTATHPDGAVRTTKLSNYVAKFYKSDWYEDAEAPVSTAYRKVALDRHNVELFDMYDSAFLMEGMFASMKPEDMKAALALGEKITKRIGLARVDRNNWLLFYEYARAARYTSEFAAATPAVVEPPPPAPKGGKHGKAVPPAPVNTAAQMALRADELEAALVASEAAMSFKPYEDGINTALKAGNRDRALALLEKTDKKFSLARSTLPKTISFYGRVNKTERVAELVTYCQTTYIDIRDECSTAGKVK